MDNKYNIVRKWLKKIEATDPNIVGLYYLNSKKDRLSVKLLEVNTDTIPTGIQPLGFSPTKDFPYELKLITITPEEFEKVKNKELLLPNDWKINYVFKGNKLKKYER